MVFLKVILCMCFDWILVGEVCGVEVLDLFDVWNIGYEGGVVMFYVNNVVVGLVCLRLFIICNELVLVEIELLIGEVVYVVVYIVCIFEGGCCI